LGHSGQAKLGFKVGGRVVTGAGRQPGMLNRMTSASENSDTNFDFR
jgi:hypothetical protein